MGMTTWIAGRLGHDGGHFAISHEYWVNRVFGNWAGLGLSNMSYWEILHNVDHHTDTNTEKDPDLYHYVIFLRDHPNYHRLQVARIYCYVVWSFTTAGLLMIEPMNMLLTGSGTRPPTVRLANFRLFFWIKLVILFPAVMLGVPMWLNWDSMENKGVVFAVRVASFVFHCGVTGLLFGIFSPCHPRR